jgi:hypothetical protein
MKITVIHVKIYLIVAIVEGMTVAVLIVGHVMLVRCARKKEITNILNPLKQRFKYMYY